MSKSLAPTRGMAVALAMSAVSAPNLAGAEVEPLEEVVVVGTYLDEHVAATAASVAVGQERLRIMMPAEPEQLLRRLPGISVFRPGGPGGVSEVFLRGAESNFTAVYVDGVRLNNSSNTRGGSFDFSTLAVQEIERIDIGMGAMSAIYGSDAMAGVIRVRTAWPAAGGNHAFLEAGSESDWRAGAATSVAVGNSTELGLRASRVDGGDAVAGASLEQTNVAGRLAGRNAGGDHWQVNLRHVERERSSFSEVSGGPQRAVLPDLEVGEGEESSVALASEWTLSQNWQAEIVASWAEIEDRTATPAVPPGVLDGQPAFTTDSRFRRAEILWINRLAVTDRTQLAFGVDWVAEKGRDRGFLDLGFALLPNAFDLDRTASSGFVEFAHQWPAGFETTLALRTDHTSDTTRTSGKLGVSREIPGRGGRLWAQVANGFKMPSFFALGNPLYGNPELRPEEVTSREVGYEKSFDSGVEVGFSFFASEYRDLVDFDFETFRHINRGKTEIDGAMAYLRMQLGPSLSLGADATLTDISSDSGELRRRPENVGGLDVTWRPVESWSLNAAVRYFGKRFITSIPTGDVRENAGVVASATLRHRFSESLSLWLAIDNLFDADYQDAPGFPAPGIGARLGAEMQF